MRYERSEKSTLSSVTMSYIFAYRILTIEIKPKKAENSVRKNVIGNKKRLAFEQAGEESQKFNRDVHMFRYLVPHEIVKRSDRGEKPASVCVFAHACVMCVCMFNKLSVVEAQRGQKSLYEIDTWCAGLGFVVAAAAAVVASS